MTNLSRRSSAPSSAEVAEVGDARDVGARAPVEHAVALPFGAAARRSWAAMLVADLAPQDWLIFVYFVLLFLAVLFGAGPDRMLAGRIVVEHILVLVTGLALTRGAILRKGSFANALLYRLTLFSTTLSSYFQLRIILPAAAPRSVDAALYAFDLRVFHYEPALAWDRFVTPVTTEWFAFFYFGYFFILAIHIIPFMLLCRNMSMLARFAMAIFFTFCCGHLLYIVVPGYGPHQFLAGSFAHELPAGRFWGMVQATVADAGAQKDIFPSLHTAVPSTFTLLALRYRKQFAPYRFSAPIMLLGTSQIIIATMFLRWHYLVDICAGLALATLSVYLSDRLVTWDDARRTRLGLGPAWHALSFRT